MFILDAWIITGGTNSGVREFVGQAVRDHIITHGTRDNVVCLGIPSWGALKNRHVLEGAVNIFYFITSWVLKVSF